MIAIILVTILRGTASIYNSTCNIRRTDTIYAKLNEASSEL